jgi:hypothetical protein
LDLLLALKIIFTMIVLWPSQSTLKLHYDVNMEFEEYETQRQTDDSSVEMREYRIDIDS